MEPTTVAGRRLFAYASAELPPAKLSRDNLERLADLICRVEAEARAAAVAPLEKALRKYGRHLDGCGVWRERYGTGGNPVDGYCTCRLTDVILAATPSVREPESGGLDVEPE